MKNINSKLGYVIVITFWLAILTLWSTKTQAQVNYCDSISYTTTSTINYPLILAGNGGGLSNMVDTITWDWTVCQVATPNLCYSESGINAFFGQVSLTDTLKVCYDAYIYFMGAIYTCSGCDSLVYNPNTYQWEAMTAQPLSITELELNTNNDGKIYDLLGREIFEIQIGVMYIRNQKKYIKIN
jgi:hypothetical protein